MPNVFEKNRVDNLGQKALEGVSAEQVRGIMQVQDQLSVSLGKMTDISMKISRGVNVEIRQILRAIQETEKLSEEFRKATKDLSGIDEVNKKLIKDAYNTSQEKLTALKAGFGKFIESTEKKAEEMFRKIEEQEAKATERAKDLARIERENKDLIDEVITSTGKSNTDIEHLMEGIRSSSRELVNHQGTAKRTYGRIFDQQNFQLEKELQNYELKIKQLESLKTLDEVQKDNLEKMKDLVENTRYELDIINTATKRDMEQVQEMGDSLWESTKKGFKDMKSGFDSFKSIFDALNLHLITSSLTQGAESIIDVMSEVSRMRGMTYNSVTGVRSSFSSGDTYGGMIGAQDLMRVYQMTNLTTEYLSQIASSVAMFEKETNISNEALNGMLLWAQNTGINKRRTVETLDYLQSIRDNGAPVEDLAAFISENPALIAGSEEQYMTAAGALRANGFDQFATYLEEMISAGNTLYGADDVHLRTLFGNRMGEVEQLMNAKQYEKVVQIMMEQAKLTSDSLGNLSNLGSSKLDDVYGMNANVVSTLQQMSDPVSFLAKAMNDMRKDTSTIASNAGSAGYIDKFTKGMNEVSTSAVGELVTSFEQLTKDHPILTSLATETLTKIGGEIGKNLLSSAFKGSMKGAMEGGTETVMKNGNVLKGLGSALVSPIGIALGTSAAIFGISAGIEKAKSDEHERSENLVNINDAINKDENPDNDLEYKKKFMNMEEPGYFASDEEQQLYEDLKAQSIREGWYKQIMSGSEEPEISANALEQDQAVAESVVNSIHRIEEEEYKAHPIARIFTNIDPTAMAVNRHVTELRSSGYSDEWIIGVLKKAGIDNAEDFVKPGLIPPTEIERGFNWDEAHAHYGGEVLGFDFSDIGSDGSGGRGKNPDSNATGLNYVPYDDYLTYLHQGERVLTADQNEEYSMSGITAEVSSDLSELASKLDNTKFQKIVQDGFEYIGRKIMEASEKQSVVVAGQTTKRASLTSMYLSNQWG